MLLRSEGLDLLVRRIPKMQLGLLDVVELTVAGTFVNRSLLGIDAVRLHVIPWLPIHASRTYSIPSEYRVWRERRGASKRNRARAWSLLRLPRSRRESYLAGGDSNRFHRGQSSGQVGVSQLR